MVLNSYNQQELSLSNYLQHNDSTPGAWYCVGVVLYVLALVFMCQIV